MSEKREINLIAFALGHILKKYKLKYPHEEAKNIISEILSEFNKIYPPPSKK